MSFPAQDPPLPPQAPTGPAPVLPPGAPAPRPPVLKRPWVRYVAVGVVALGLGAAAGGSNGKDEGDTASAAGAAS